MIPKKLASRLAALLAACCLLSVPALAAEAGELVLPGGSAPKLTQLSFPEGEDNNALFSAYVSQQLFAKVGVSPASAQDPAGNRLEGVNKTAYDLLKAKIEKTAREGGSAMYTLTSEDLKLETEWTLEALKGLEDPENPSFSVPQEPDKITDEILSQIASLLLAQVPSELDVAAVENALLVDCPFDQYWFDKTLGVAFWANAVDGISYKDGVVSMPLTYFFYYRVAESYRDKDNYVPLEVNADGTPTNLENCRLEVTKDVERVYAAATIAKAIVSQYYSKSDYEKLLGYKNEICALTAYNHDAVNNSGTAYGDPWQLIYVFDGDNSTDVVCEGYAKAFQYLCDLTVFDGDVACYLVEGTMAGGTGDGGDGQPGPHMWNVVRIGGQSYLVDVTNSDEGSIGQDGGLFLAGTAERDGSNPAGYIFRLGKNSAVTYWYGDLDSDGNITQNEMETVWGSKVLTLAEESYFPAPSETGKIDTVTPQEGGGKLSVRVSGSVDQPSWLLAAGYDGNNRLTGVFPVELSAAGAYNKELLLPAGTVSFKVLLTGGESWAPLYRAWVSE